MKSPVLQVSKLLSIPDESELPDLLPAFYYPSDHLSIGCEFNVLVEEVDTESEEIKKFREEHNLLVVKTNLKNLKSKMNSHLNTNDPTNNSTVAGDFKLIGNVFVDKIGRFLKKYTKEKFETSTVLAKLVKDCLDSIEEHIATLTKEIKDSNVLQKVVKLDDNDFNRWALHILMNHQLEKSEDLHNVLKGKFTEIPGILQDIIFVKTFIQLYYVIIKMKLASPPSSLFWDNDKEFDQDRHIIYRLQCKKSGKIFKVVFPGYQVLDLLSEELRVFCLSIVETEIGEDQE